MIIIRLLHFRHTKYLFATLISGYLFTGCQTTRNVNADVADPPVVEEEIQAQAPVSTIDSPEDIELDLVFIYSAPDINNDQPTVLTPDLPDTEDVIANVSLEEQVESILSRPGTEFTPMEFDSLAYSEYLQQSNAWYRLQTGMKMDQVHNKRIETQMDWYVRHPDYLKRVMERARPFLPFILDEIEARNLPTEFALLPIVESAYQTFAYSHGRASGMWQIIPSTARFLGLKQNWWYDGRRDIIESTRAALNYLESLGEQFDGDWELALAAYNAGPGKIRNAVKYNKKRGKPADFWHLTRIRKETRDYVPKLLALKNLFTEPEAYGLNLLPVDNVTDYDIVELEGQIDLALAADLAGISVNQLYQLNPAFNRWATAPRGPHRLLLPKDKSKQFIEALNELPPEKRIKWVRHKIKPGQTLSEISLKYGTTVALIKNVNKIRGTQIRAGKYLMVPTATRSLNSYSMSQTARLNKIQNTQRSGTKKTHIVRPGQSLWAIARRYGVSIRTLAKWNGMAPRDTLRVGQKLVIWSKNTPAVQKVSFNMTGPDQGLHALRYTVRKGDSLSRIADRFNIRVSDIKRWNRIGKYLQPGQKLKLYVDITRQSG